MMLVAGIFAASAADVTVHFPAEIGPGTADGLFEDTGKNNKVLTTFEAQGFTFTFAKNDGSSDPAYYSYINKGTGADEGAVRLYADNAMTVTAPAGGTIKSIEFTLAGGTWNHADSDAGYPVSSGTFTAGFAASTQAKTATWAGEAAELKLQVKNEKNAADKWPQLRIMTMTIVYTAGVETKCATPRFDLAEGKFYTAQEVALTTSTDGAKIMYSINGGAEAEYAAPIQLSDVGTYAITAYAKKDGLENSDNATATYEIAAPVEVGSIDEFIMQGESDATAAYKWTFPVTVTAQMPSYLYVKDNNGSAMLIYGSQVPTYKTGDVLPAGIVGKYKNYNGLYEMEYPEAATFGTATANKGEEKVFMKAGEITVDDQNKVVYITNATYAAEGKTLTDASGSINVYYQKAWNIDSATDGEYDVRCAVAVYKNAAQVYPMEFLPAGSGVDSAVAEAVEINAVKGAVEVVATGNVAIYNAAGQIVGSRYVDGAATINVAPGFYIVRAADTVAKVIVK